MEPQRATGLDRADAIPYEQIDCEIRYLVRLMNRFEGIRTLFSCAGHKETEETYISLSVESQNRLETFLRGLPFLGWHGAVVANQFSWTAIYVNAVLDGDSHLRYDLRISGHPQHAQRLLLGEIERCLTEALAIPEDARLSSPKHASVHSADTEHYSR